MCISDWSSDVCSSDGGLGHAEVPVAGDACGTGVSRQAGEGGGMNVEEASPSSGSSFPRKREPSGLVFRSTPGSPESHWVDQHFGPLTTPSALACLPAAPCPAPAPATGTEPAR